jgi:hypothetical protein
VEAARLGRGGVVTMIELGDMDAMALAGGGRRRPPLAH